MLSIRYQWYEAFKLGYVKFEILFYSQNNFFPKFAKQRHEKHVWNFKNSQAAYLEAKIHKFFIKDHFDQCIDKIFKIRWESSATVHLFAFYSVNDNGLRMKWTKLHKRWSGIWPTWSWRWIRASTTWARPSTCSTTFPGFYPMSAKRMKYLGICCLPRHLSHLCRQRQVSSRRNYQYF